MSETNNFYSKTNPELVTAKAIDELNSTIIVTDTTKAPTLGNSSLNIYKKYIKPNIVPIVILIAFIAFMVYRYMTNKKIKEKKESFDPSKKLTDPTQQALELHETDRHHEFDHVINQVVEKNEIDEILNDNSIYDDIYKPDPSERQDYAGTNNKALNDPIIKMDHPYGYDNDFIELENKMLDFSTTKNKQSIDQVSSLIFN